MSNYVKSANAFKLRSPVGPTLSMSSVPLARAEPTAGLVYQKVQPVAPLNTALSGRSAVVSQPIVSSAPKSMPPPLNQLPASGTHRLADALSRSGSIPNLQSNPKISYSRFLAAAGNTHPNTVSENALAVTSSSSVISSSRPSSAVAASRAAAARAHPPFMPLPAAAPTPSKSASSHVESNIAAAISTIVVPSQHMEDVSIPIASVSTNSSPVQSQTNHLTLIPSISIPVVTPMSPLAAPVVTSPEAEHVPRTENISPLSNLPSTNEAVVAEFEADTRTVSSISPVEHMSVQAPSVSIVPAVEARVDFVPPPALDDAALAQMEDEMRFLQHHHALLQQHQLHQQQYLDAIEDQNSRAPALSPARPYSAPHSVATAAASIARLRESTAGGFAATGAVPLAAQSRIFPQRQTLRETPLHVRIAEVRMRQSAVQREGERAERIHRRTMSSGVSRGRLMGMLAAGPALPGVSDPTVSELDDEFVQLDDDDGVPEIPEDSVMIDRPRQRPMSALQTSESTAQLLSQQKLLTPSATQESHEMGKPRSSTSLLMRPVTAQPSTKSFHSELEHFIKASATHALNVAPAATKLAHSQSSSSIASKRPMSSPVHSRAREQQQSTQTLRKSPIKDQYTRPDSAFSVSSYISTDTIPPMRLSPSPSLQLALSSSIQAGVGPEFDPTSPNNASAVHALSAAQAVQRMYTASDCKRAWSDFLPSASQSVVNERLVTPAWTTAAASDDVVHLINRYARVARLFAPQRSSTLPLSSPSPMHLTADDKILFDSLIGLAHLPAGGEDEAEFLTPVKAHLSGLFSHDITLDHSVPESAPQPKSLNLSQALGLRRELACINQFAQELVFQVGTQCHERGDLLFHLWRRHDEIAHTLASVAETTARASLMQTAFHFFADSRVTVIHSNKPLAQSLLSTNSDGFPSEWANAPEGSLELKAWTLMQQNKELSLKLSDSQTREADAVRALKLNEEQRGAEIPRLTRQLEASHALYAEATQKYHDTLMQHDQRLARATTALAHMNLSVASFAALCSRLKAQLAEHVGYDTADLFAAEGQGVAHGLPVPQVDPESFELKLPALARLVENAVEVVLPVPDVDPRLKSSTPSRTSLISPVKRSSFVSPSGRTASASSPITQSLMFGDDLASGDTIWEEQPAELEQAALTLFSPSASGSRIQSRIASRATTRPGTPTREQQNTMMVSLIQRSASSVELASSSSTVSSVARPQPTRSRSTGNLLSPSKTRSRNNFLVPVASDDDNVVSVRVQQYQPINALVWDVDPLKRGFSDECHWSAKRESLPLAKTEQDLDSSCVVVLDTGAIEPALLDGLDQMLNSLRFQPTLSLKQHTGFVPFSDVFIGPGARARKINIPIPPSAIMDIPAPIAEPVVEPSTVQYEPEPAPVVNTVSAFLSAKNPSEDSTSPQTESVPESQPVAGPSSPTAASAMPSPIEPAKPNVPAVLVSPPKPVRVRPVVNQHYMAFIECNDSTGAQNAKALLDGLISGGVKLRCRMARVYPTDTLVLQGLYMPPKACALPVTVPAQGNKSDISAKAEAARVSSALRAEALAKCKARARRLCSAFGNVERVNVEGDSMSDVSMMNGSVSVLVKLDTTEAAIQAILALQGRRLPLKGRPRGVAASASVPALRLSFADVSADYWAELDDDHDDEPLLDDDESDDEDDMDPDVLLRRQRRAAELAARMRMQALEERAAASEKAVSELRTQLESATEELQKAIQLKDASDSKLEKLQMDMMNINDQTRDMRRALDMAKLEVGQKSEQLARQESTIDELQQRCYDLGKQLEAAATAAHTTQQPVASTAESRISVDAVQSLMHARKRIARMTLLYAFARSRLIKRRIDDRRWTRVTKDDSILPTAAVTACATEVNQSRHAGQKWRLLELLGGDGLLQDVTGPLPPKSWLLEWAYQLYNVCKSSKQPEPLCQQAVVLIRASTSASHRENYAVSTANMLIVAALVYAHSDARIRTFLELLNSDDVQALRNYLHDAATSDSSAATMQVTVVTGTYNSFASSFDKAGVHELANTYVPVLPLSAAQLAAFLNGNTGQSSASSGYRFGGASVSQIDMSAAAPEVGAVAHATGSITTGPHRSRVGSTRPGAAMAVSELFALVAAHPADPATLPPAVIQQTPEVVALNQTVSQAHALARAMANHEAPLERRQAEAELDAYFGKELADFGSVGPMLNPSASTASLEQSMSHSHSSTLLRSTKRVATPAPPTPASIPSNLAAVPSFVASAIQAATVQAAVAAQVAVAQSTMGRRRNDQRPMSASASFLRSSSAAQLGLSQVPTTPVSIRPSAPREAWMHSIQQASPHVSTTASLQQALVSQYSTTNLQPVDAPVQVPLTLSTLTQAMHAPVDHHAFVPTHLAPATRPLTASMTRVRVPTATSAAATTPTATQATVRAFQQARAASATPHASQSSK